VGSLAARVSEAVWYQNHWLGLGLAPLGWLYCGIALLRRWGYRREWLGSFAAPVPVIVVGNLTVGGTGKTPLVVWLAARLAEAGRRPGVALRGYGGGAAASPCRVSLDSNPSDIGDEAVLLAQRTNCAVVVGRDRVAAARALAGEQGCDLVITDDGLQHYRLRRQLEIMVVDGVREFGNRRCLPAGPLREPTSRLDSVDLVITNGGDRALGYRMRVVPGAAVSLVDPARQRPLSAFVGNPVAAVAGIGHPQRFFSMLRELGLTVTEWPYPDHHAFTEKDLASWPPGPVLMTEKDAVKCRRFARGEHWYVPISAMPEQGFIDALDRALAGLKKGNGENDGY
jgi:tetraacyldisaccharide 4'-kinase